MVQKDGRLEKIECGDMDRFNEEEQRRHVVWLA
jgi:OTU domain-containing protein 6